mmetsp:Transcript_1509/g.1324  ORF Transcript_1509/g.1324 Transcript_1509/m.1324 type:complete len:139 (-) Transcript_1509:15-431(-)
MNSNLSTTSKISKSIAHKAFRLRNKAINNSQNIFNLTNNSSFQTPQNQVSPNQNPQNKKPQYLNSQNLPSKIYFQAPNSNIHKLSTRSDRRIAKISYLEGRTNSQVNRRKKSQFYCGKSKHLESRMLSRSKSRSYKVL